MALEINTLITLKFAQDYASASKHEDDEMHLLYEGQGHQVYRKVVQHI